MIRYLKPLITPHCGGYFETHFILAKIGIAMTCWNGKTINNLMIWYHYVLKLKRPFKCSYHMLL